MSVSGLPRTVAVLGGGAMGSALVPSLRRANLRVVAAWSRSPHPGQWRSGPLPRALREAELIFIAVADAAVAEVCAQLAAERLLMPGQVVAHLAGTLPLSVLDPALEAGARTGSLHPLRAVVLNGPPDALKGATASIAGSDETARSVLAAVAHALGLSPLVVDDRRRALYHAAAVLAGGAQVALFAEAVRAFQMATGAEEPEARAALLPLSLGALNALFGRHPAAALTGPVPRGDAETVAAHRAALRAADPALLPLYDALATASLRLAREGQRASDEALARVAAALAGSVPPAPAALPVPAPSIPSPARAPAPVTRSSTPRRPKPTSERPAASSRSSAPRGRPRAPRPRVPEPRKRR
jgi:predicted short-subunit dehydrogenase-like oxidoreductase (DUF2520 family)